MFRYLTAGVVVTCLLFSGCTSTPEYAQRLDNVRNQYQSLVNTTDIQQYAAAALNEADTAISKAEEMIDEDAESELINHQIYMAQRKLDIAEQVAVMNKSQEIVSNAELARKDVLLGLREQEASQLRQEAQDMAQRADALEQELTDLTTEETDRGLVMVPGNILFEFDSANLKPGTERTIQKIAEFLNSYPERNIRIEGFTDSVGSEEYNQQLSQARAQAVRDQLVQAGVSPNRVSVEGYGEQFPIAPNDTMAGRLENRRVEIVVSTEDGERITARGNR